MAREAAEVGEMALSEIRVGESAIVASLELPHDVRDHLMHLGFLPDASIDVLRRAPAGDPTVYRVEGAEIALRRETARYIHVRPRDPGRDQI
jgi:Fe2+ transport system protein FeoA